MSSSLESTQGSIWSEAWSIAAIVFMSFVLLMIGVRWVYSTFTVRVVVSPSTTAASASTSEQSV